MKNPSVRPSIHRVKEEINAVQAHSQSVNGGGSTLDPKQTLLLNELNIRLEELRHLFSKSY